MSTAKRDKLGEGWRQKSTRERRGSEWGGNGVEGEGGRGEGEEVTTSRSQDHPEGHRRC